MINQAMSADMLKVMLLSGQNNHQWQETSPKIKSILENTGKFKVTIENHPAQMTATSLADYDVIVSDWNTWGQNEQASITNFPVAAREALFGFVRNGKGHVTVHAGASSFYDSPEYHQMTLASWKLGQTQHGPIHSFRVRIENLSHPITAGISDFTATDELWVKPGIEPKAKVIASSFSSADQPQGSGQFEPAAVVSNFGQGRSFALLLGHDVKSMNNPGFIALLTRGTEWAASGKVTLPPPKALAVAPDSKLLEERERNPSP
jgi:type 1 glutamine amidotransferase